MRRLWAVARETFLECLRTKLAVGFALLLWTILVILGFYVTGDGTLKGRLQTFLDYSSLVTQLILALATLLLIVSIVTEDIRRKTIFTVAAKPMARWQYVLGRWLGVMMLSLGGLALAMLTMYGLAHHIRSQPTKVEREIAAGRLRPGTLDLDRMTLESDVFVARAVHRPDPLRVDQKVEARYRQLAEERSEEDLIREQIRAELESARGRPAEDKATEADEIARRAADPDVRQRVIEKYKAELRKAITDEELLLEPGEGGVALRFSGLTRPRDPKQKLQLRYRLRAVRRPRSGTLISDWAISGMAAWTQTDSADTASSAPIPPQAIREDGTLTLFYRNSRYSPSAVNLKLNDISLYYPVASFEANLLRAALLVGQRLMFLAALGLLFATFLSFPVTCMACLVLLVIGVMGHFIVEATNLAPYASAGPGAFDYFSHWLVRIFFKIMPQLPLMGSPGDALVDGANIGWLQVGAEFLTGTGVRALAALLLGWLIFRRRELARVQV